MPAMLTHKVHSPYEIASASLFVYAIRMDFCKLIHENDTDVCTVMPSTYSFPLAFLLFLHCILPYASAQQLLSIESAMQYAMERNERSIAADLRIEAADSRVAKARAFFFPTLEFAGNYTRRQFETKRVIGGEEITIQSLNALSASATGNLTLLDPRLFSAYAQVRSDRDATTATEMNTKLGIGFETGHTYLIALDYDAVDRAAFRRMALAGENLSAARARFEAQLVGSNDVTRAELESASAEREWTAAEGSNSVARLHLASLIHDEADFTLSQPDALLADTARFSDNIDVLFRLAKELRKDLLARKAGIESLHASAKEALLRSLPNIAGIAQYRVTNEAGFSGKNETWYAGVNLSWSLFDGGIWYYDRQEREALTRVADLELRSAERNLLVEIQSGLVALANAKASKQVAAVALAVAEKNAKETSALYREGLASALEVSDANLQLFNAEVAASQSMYVLATALLGLRQTLGLHPTGKDLKP